MTEKFTQLTNAHKIEHFDCGSITINEYLKEYALKFQKDRLHKSWILTDNEKIVGYFALSVHHIRHRFSEIRFKTKWGTYPPFTPCLFIDMLGVDLNYSSTYKKYGSKLIEEVIRIADKINESAGIRLILLEALPNSLGFYYKKGFSILFNKDNIGEIKKFKKLFDIEFKIDEQYNQISTSEENYEKIRDLVIDNKIKPISMFLDLL